MKLSQKKKAYNKLNNKNQEQKRYSIEIIYTLYIYSILIYYSQTTKGNFILFY